MNLRQQFPILENNPDLIYLDSGATTHKPKSVIKTMTEFLEKDYGTVHRGIYSLSAKATDRYNQSREHMQQFINAPNIENVIFTKGTTESINLVAKGYVEDLISEGDEILISEVEHHANFVPWQMIAKNKNASVIYAPVTDDGDLNCEDFFKLITDKTKFIAITHISNVLGSVFPVKKIIEKAKEKSIPILIDGAQAIAHESIDLIDLDPDFYCFSGHKMYGPTGIGICYINNRVINDVKPVTFGGDMIELVSKERTTFTKAPLKFEAGTPAILEAIGLKTAIEFIENIGRESIKKYENDLVEELINEFDSLDFIERIGRPSEQSSAVSFNVTGIHPHDLGTILDENNIAVRVGHHCAQPAMRRFNVVATARVSFGVYNESNDIKQLIKGLKEARKVFGY
ncbi:MAG: SufS family cysteine desulfurase [Candidatus Margulisiibacteriota bacterium]|nr:SufS family cysteine desulfurase [Candidatus Margulisiibacteriota bacterium]